MSGLLATASSGLMAAQRSLEIAQHNISNANTDGYSRQTVELGARAAQFSGDGYVGQGVNISNITRSYDQFINKQLTSSTSAFGDVDQFHQLATSVDNLMADPTTGMAPVLNRFFSALSEVANDPTSIPSRQVLLSETNNVTQGFNRINGRFEEIRTQNNNEIGAKIDEINSLAGSIANLNVQISTSLAQTQGLKQPNDLLDQKDALLSKLAGIVNISVVPQKDGASSVFIGNGQALVLNGHAAVFTTLQPQYDPGRLGIGIKTANGAIEVTNQITGGTLGGALRFRDEVLDPAQQKLGLVAVGLAMGVNAIHEKGFDLSGAAGSALFNFSGIAVPVTPNSTNIGNAVVAAKFEDGNVNPSAAANLDYSDFKLKYVNAGNGVDYTLTRVRDNQVINLTASTPVNGVSTLSLATTQPPNTNVTALPGIDIQVDLSGGKTISVGDESVIRPTYSAAQKIGVNIDDPSKIAAATNIELDPVTKLPVPKLDTLGNPVKDALGNPVYVTTSGPMPGDNRNVLQLADLGNKLSMLGGSATVNDAYGQIVSSVGTLTNAAALSSSAQQTLLNQTKGAREGLAGVNLDEEAANLIKFQQAYQASAQSISVARSLFDTLISAVK
ncbi:flagellar hook-associated protein FlgK [Methylobacter sp.]|uniref:flagellar hook-associated protein FlgK n=1 Tax=Methylobacter sp. TaxID=2051955 RepID=UPI0024894F17|nr:flagellar hook-associated protein FlgK [Methylobacter sp.]MDI1277128.1 flagellar hook-associated protein FlgK [Methylobacter sp.]MDI1357689.1 flagellar hook-associated protein FlgK [Methylobacter sp.]